jgi:AraC family transcriptional regulator
MVVAGRGRIVIWQGGSLWILQGEHETEQTGFHSHHFIQLTLALDGAFELRTRDDCLAAPCVGVAADAEHIFRASGIVAFLFVDPESRAGKSLSAQAFSASDLAAFSSPAIAEAMTALADCFRANTCQTELSRIGEAVVESLAPASAASPVDARVERMIAHAEANLGGRLSLDTAAGAACLSPSRARHLFVEQTGLPFKSYILWLRIKRAVELYARGASLTEVAHEAGFADSAHLSRTFRRTFGVPAASLRVTA